MKPSLCTTRRPRRQARDGSTCLIVAGGPPPIIWSGADPFEASPSARFLPSFTFDFTAFVISSLSSISHFQASTSIRSTYFSILINTYRLPFTSPILLTFVSFGFAAIRREGGEDGPR
jgi:hypothetical protein